MLAFAALSVQAQFGDDKTLYLTKSLSSESINDVRAETSGGSIAVSGVNPSEAKIEVYVQGNNNRNLSKEEISQRIREDYNLDISVSGNKLTAIARPKSRMFNWRNALNISFRILVPQNVSTDLSTSGGSIYLTNLSGTEDFSTSGGSLHVDQVSGKITGTTSGGSIHVSESKDDINLSTSGGSIDAFNCSGKIKLSTSGGSLKLTALKGNVDASTSGGSVKGSDISGELSAHTSGGNVTLTDLSCSVETSTSGGNINVEVKDPGKYIKINNSGGSVTLQIPKDKGYDLRLSGKVRTESLNNFSGTTEEDELNGKLNGGGIPVTVDAGGGRINLSFR